MEIDQKRAWLKNHIEGLSDEVIDNTYEYVTNLTADQSIGTGEWVNPPWSHELRCYVCGYTWYPIYAPDKCGYFCQESYLCPKGCTPEQHILLKN
jgi:hypothetical protein